MFLVLCRKSKCVASSQSCARLVNDNFGSPKILNQIRNTDWPFPSIVSQPAVGTLRMYILLVMPVLGLV